MIFYDMDLDPTELTDLGGLLLSEQRGDDVTSKQGQVGCSTRADTECARSRGGKGLAGGQGPSTE